MVLAKDRIIYIRTILTVVRDDEVHAAESGVLFYGRQELRKFRSRYVKQGELSSYANSLKSEVN